MIIVTGGAGFIGSAVVWKLNKMGIDDIIIVDRLGIGDKWKNLNGLNYADVLHKDEFIDMVMEGNCNYKPEAIIHLGACSSTTEKDADYLLFNNYQYSVEVAKFALDNAARFIYASSAATYGEGENGYTDNENEIEKLRPLNMYGYSKQMFDVWLKKNNLLEEVVGLKYFNVFGPNEYHKDDMRSVVHKAFGQIEETGKVKLFKSYIDEYKDGEQMRDFIYVKDAVDMSLFFLENKNANGIFNIGTGISRTWNDLVFSVFKGMNKEIDIEYIDMPDHLKNKYQYYTQADNSKLIKAGYSKKIRSLEESVEDYVVNYLMSDSYLGWQK